MDRLDAMQAFVRLAEGNTFADVASELRVRQSTVSKWLAELEAQIGVQLIVDSPSDTTAQIEDIIVKRGSDVVAQTAMVNCESGLNSSLASIVDGRRTWRIDAGQPVSFGFVCGVPAFEPSHPSSGTFAAELIFGVLVGGESHQLTQAIDVRFDAPVPNGSGQAFCGL